MKNVSFFQFAIIGSLLLLGTMAKSEDCLEDAEGSCNGSNGEGWCCPYTGKFALLSYFVPLISSYSSTDWECCPAPHEDYCAETAEYCSGIPTASNLKKVYRSPKSCQGTMCKGSDNVDWCCPQADWVCCADKPDSCAFDLQTCESIPDKDKRPGNGLIQDKMFRPWFVRPGY